MQMRMSIRTVGVAAALALASMGAQAQSVSPKMNFFVTSAGSGKGGDLGGLAGADKICQTLAEAVGAGKKTWRAYLSTTSAGGGKVINARDRIGKGPWFNAKGEMVAANLDDLHSAANKITKQSALTEKGTIVNGRGDQPNMHDILTGSDAQGQAIIGGTADTTCANWTSSSTGSAVVGHHDRIGLNDQANMKSWNMSHPSRGCSQDNLRSTGGNGFFYCFAAK
jgi:hypothetical protein